MIPILSCCRRQVCCSPIIFRAFSILPIKGDSQSHYRVPSSGGCLLPPVKHSEMSFLYSGGQLINSRSGSTRSAFGACGLDLSKFVGSFRAGVYRHLRSEGALCKMAPGAELVRPPSPAISIGAPHSLPRRLPKLSSDYNYSLIRPGAPGAIYSPPAYGSRICAGERQRESPAW